MNQPLKPSTSVLGKSIDLSSLFFYRKSDVVYQLTFDFCNRYIHLYKDRTRDQMIQAARSCKQNIVEGFADGITSTEMQLKLLNVACASLKELREDFEDYIKSRHLAFFQQGEGRFSAMLDFCRKHNDLLDYEQFFAQWNDEQMCNYAITLCHIIDKMMVSFLKHLDKEFVTEGGIKERMYRARTQYRQEQDERFKQLETENAQLKQALSVAQADAQKWRSAYENLKTRALKAYYQQLEEIEKLKEELQKLKKNKS